MNDLLDFAILRHGGIDRWHQASAISATVHVCGDFWAFKGQPGRLGWESVTADIHRQRITMTPFGPGPAWTVLGARAADMIAKFTGILAV